MFSLLSLKTVEISIFSLVVLQTYSLINKEKRVICLLSEENNNMTAFCYFYNEERVSKKRRRKDNIG
jgi:hypothetical protein